MSREDNIKLPIISCSVDASLARLWNSMTGKNPARISQILAGINHRRLFNFLEFMHHNCLHNQLLRYSHERLEKYQIILMCCPRLVLTQFLHSIHEQCVVNILEQSDVIWMIYFVGLIEFGHDDEVNMMLNFLMRIYDFTFVSSLVLFLIREASNQELQQHIRQRIFEFVCRNTQMVMMIVQSELEEGERMDVEDFVYLMNRWASNFSRINGFNFVHSWNTILPHSQPVQQPQHLVVDAHAFVERTFPSAHPLHPSRSYCCIMCHCTSDELNDNGNRLVVRMLPCCSSMCKDSNDMKYACHQCLVEWVKTCNTLNPAQEFKRTDEFSCPNCRHSIPFFP